MAPVKRRLDFGENSEQSRIASRDFLEKELKECYQDAKLLWNFDFVEGVPLTGGRFEWVPVTQDDQIPEAYNNAVHPGKNTVVNAIEGLHIVDGNKVQRVTGVVTTRKKLAQRLITSMMAIKKSVSSRTKSAGRESLAKLRKAISIKSEPATNTDIWRLPSTSNSEPTPTRT